MRDRVRVFPKLMTILPRSARLALRHLVARGDGCLRAVLGQDAGVALRSSVRVQLWFRLFWLTLRRPRRGHCLCGSDDDLCHRGDRGDRGWMLAAFALGRSRRGERFPIVLRTIAPAEALPKVPRRGRSPRRAARPFKELPNMSEQHVAGWLHFFLDCWSRKGWTAGASPARSTTGS